ncbi:MAG: hypothetical protein ACRDLM_10730 [Gaiellaceae bacterium]
MPRTDAGYVSWLPARAAALVILLLAIVGTVGVFTFARPRPGPSTIPPPPGVGISYTKVAFNAADARRAFAAVGINLIQHTHEPQPAKAAPIVDLSTANVIVEVGAFGNPAKVAAYGFSDYLTFSHGHWLRTPTSCTGGTTAAERWRANIRVIVNCSLAGSNATAWLARVNRALAHL